MKSIELYKKLYSNLPVTQNETSDFRLNPLNMLLNLYKKDIKKLDFNDRPEKWDELIVRIASLCEAINRAIKESYRGAHAKAFRIIKNQIDGYSSKGKNITNLRSKTFVTIIQKGNNFYRMRVVPSTQRQSLKKYDMFHIPFEMRGKIKTQRYSVYGHPCLYLGISTYACWEEMKRPPLDQCVVSRVENQRDIYLFDLRIPEFDEWQKNLYSHLCIYPLLLSCMVKAKDETNEYVPEYTIPQLIMEWLIFHNNFKVTDNIKIDGIIYTSTHINKDFNYPNEKHYNIAIPTIKTLAKKGHCAELSKTFTLTQPTYYEIEKLKHKNLHDTPILNGDNESERKYNLSDFGELELYLNEYEARPISDK